MRLTRLMEVGKAAARGGGGVGRCSLCQGPSVFVVAMENRREGVLCVRCRSNPRQRALIQVLHDEVPDWPNRAVYEAGRTGAASRLLSERCGRFMTSNYLPEVAWGQYVDGVRSENLECLTFTDQSFDAVVTQDVFEHVFDTDAAFAEVARVLRPGGVHVFTVPFDTERRSSLRARRRDGIVEHLQPPEYHGDPLDPSGVLVVTDWGMDLPDYVERISGLKSEVVRMRDPSGRVRVPTPVFVSRKAG